MVKKAIHLILLKLLIVVICTGWIGLWLAKPTKLWTRIWHEVEDTSRNTLFNYYGLNFAVYSFPAIAMAILVLLYLDLQPKKLTSRQTRWISFAELFNPVVINGTFGVLSSLEILLATSFILFLGWTFYMRISNDFHKMKPASISQMNIWQFKYLKVATRFGSLAEACLVLMLLPTLRGMSLFRVLGLPFETSIRYHIWLGTAMLFFSTAHGVSTLFIWSIQHRIQTEIWKWQNVGRVYLAGELALIAAIVIWITSLPAIRRKRFEIFYYTHHLYIMFLIFFLFHAGDRHFYTVLGGVLLFGIDKLQRIVQSRPQTCVINACILPCNAVQLALPKDPRLSYLPTSMVFLKIPQLSRFQWHPFSIISSSSAQEDTLSILAKSEGEWTEALHTLVQSNINKLSCIPVAVEGPYGPSSLNFSRYESLILIAGGIGVSPILSILQDLAYSNDRLKLPTRITFIHVIKRSKDVCLLNSILPILQNHQKKGWNLKLKVFVTQEKRVNIDLLELFNGMASQVQNINLNKTCKHYVILGTESSTWMAAMVFISTIMFMFLVNSFSHIFAPDMLKNSKQKIPSVLPDVVVICSFFLAVVSSCAITIILRWRKLRQQSSPNAQKQPKSVELVNQSSINAGELHFGARPDFTETLSEFLDGTCGRNMGVFVCGPETMTQDVAMFCKQNTKSFQHGSKRTKLSFNFHSLNFAL